MKKRKIRTKTKQNSFLWIIVLVLGIWASCYFIHQKVEAPAKIQENQRALFIEKVGRSAQKVEQERPIHIYPSVTIAQAILESDWGKSELAVKYHNLYGVKDPNGNKKILTKEFENGKWKKVDAPFKIYSSEEESIEDHADKIQYGTSWNSLQYQKVWQAKSYEESARALQSSGYATDPEYAAKLIKLIRQYNLNKYDIYPRGK